MIAIFAACDDLGRAVAFRLPAASVDGVDDAGVRFHLPERPGQALKVPHLEVPAMPASGQMPAGFVKEEG